MILIAGKLLPYQPQRSGSISLGPGACTTQSKTAQRAEAAEKLLSLVLRSSNGLKGLTMSSENDAGWKGPLEACVHA